MLPGHGAGSAPSLYFPPVLHGHNVLMVLEGTVKFKGFAGEHLLLWGSKPSALVVLVGMNPAGLRCLPAVPAKVIFKFWLCPGAEEQGMLLP